MLTETENKNVYTTEPKCTLSTTAKIAANNPECKILSTKMTPENN